MTTAKQKVENWLDECGYVHGNSVVIYQSIGSDYLHTVSYFKTGNYPNLKILSLTNPDGKVHIPPADLHEDDKPEPVDKALQEYVKCLGKHDGNDRWIACCNEINSRLLALEAKVG